MSGSESASEDVTRWTTAASDVLSSGNRPRVGALLGRYVVIEELGRGGMGIVLRAYDARLQREVALKVVRTEAISAQAEARLVREAQAMAQLSHPNVVGIYDVVVGEPLVESSEGASDSTASQVMLAMEYVEGQTLRKWLEHESRTPAQIVDAFVQAGRGLAAAHREGLTHRDFKPANVLVGDDGRVRVTDFGLVRIDTERSSSDSFAADEPTTPAPGDSRAGELTQAGTVLGTPRYMAPEQHRGEASAPAVDQYAFCVALWEALHEEAPFIGRGMGLVEAKLAGPPAWQRKRGVSSRLAEAVRRGLAPDPSQRFPTMDALLAVLSKEARTNRRKWASAAVLGTTAVLGTAWYVGSGEQPCAGAPLQLAEVWNAERRGEIEASFRNAQVKFGASVWQRVGPQLDAWADQWQAHHTEACEATQVRKEQSEAVMDLRMACLQRARQQFEAAVDVLAEATPKAIEKAHEVVGDLPDLPACADIEALQAEVAPPDPEDAEAVAEIRSELAWARAHRRVAQYDAAMSAARRAEEASQRVSYEPVRTEVWLELGNLHDAMGQYEPAEAALRRALEHASTFKQWADVRSAAAKLVYVLGYRQAKTQEALALRELALGLAAHDARAEADVRANLAVVLAARGEYDEAEAEFRATLELRTEALGPDHSDVAMSRDNLASVLQAKGKYLEAEAEQRAVLALRREALGPEHPDVAASHNNLGNGLREQGRYAEAEAEHRTALAIWTATFEADHPLIAMSRNNLAATLIDQGKHAEAEDHLRAALEAKVKSLGPRHPDVAMLRTNIATMAYMQGDHEEAESGHREALAVWIEAVGPDHPDLATPRSNLAAVLMAQGEYAEAEREFRAALDLQTQALGPDHPSVGESLLNVANALLEQDRREEAVELLDRAWTIQRDADTPAATKGRIAFSLAQSLWPDETQRDRARSVAAEAAKAYEEAGEAEAQTRREVERWLRQHS